MAGAGALLTAFGLPTPAPGETGTAASGVNTWGGIEAAGYGDGTRDNTDPKAFVNIILFDANYKFLDVAYAQLKGTTLYYMTASYTVKQAGYAYLYVSNEQSVQTDVYFDDVKMSYTPNRVVQYNEYYPFGLQAANSWTRSGAVGNNFLGNGGSEINTTTGVYDLDWRNYDPALGRLNQVDLMADKYGSLSPYHYSFNNPVGFVDPSGLSAITNGTWEPGDPDPGAGDQQRAQGGGGDGVVVEIRAGNLSITINMNEMTAMGISVSLDNGQISGVSAINSMELSSTGTLYVSGFQVYSRNTGDMDAGKIVQEGWTDVTENYSIKKLDPWIGQAMVTNEYSPATGPDAEDIANFWTGFIDPSLAGYKRSNFISPAGMVGGYGAMANVGEIGSKHLSNDLAAAGVFKNGGIGFGYLGTGLTLLEGFNDGNFSMGDAAKVGIGAIMIGASAPEALTYAIVDFGTFIATGYSLTDRVAAGIDNSLKH